MSPLDLSIVIVSHNTAEMTERALTSLMVETVRTNYEVIVADLGSSDNSADMIDEHPVRANLMRLPEGTKPARAATMAARAAKGKYILILNSDTMIIDRAIDKLVDFARANPTARIWGGRTIFHNGTLNATSCWRRMSAWNLFCRATGLTGVFRNSEIFNGEAYGGWQRDHRREVDIITDSFFLIERDLWGGLRGFDPVFESYGQDADLCLRARAFSARPMVTPTATIVHHGQVGMLDRADRTVELLTAKATLIVRHWRPAMVPLGLALLAAWPLTRAMSTTLVAKVTGSAKTGFLARHWGEVWRRRREWQWGYARATRSEAANPALASSAP